MASEYSLQPSAVLYASTLCSGTYIWTLSVMKGFPDTAVGGTVARTVTLYPSSTLV